MLKTNPNPDVSDEPRTLCSGLLSNGIPICRPSHLSSASFEPYSLQISESPTRGFLTKGNNSPATMSGHPASLVNTNLPQVPSDTSDLSEAANHAGSASNTVADTYGGGKKERLVSKGERDGQTTQREHRRPPATEDFGVSPSPPRNVVTDVPSEPSCVPSPNKPPVSHTDHTVSHTDRGPPFVAPSAAATFYSFVILHVPEDQEEAGRVCAILNNLKIGEGTTFCEGFQAAGVSPLRCLEDAVENSAYIILLLTSRFLSKWGEFQTNAVLMNSIVDVNKNDTVIPFISKCNPPAAKIPLAINSLTCLDESGKLFSKLVQNTFKQEKIRTQRERWQRQRQLQAAADLANSLKEKERLAINLSELLSDLPPHLMPATTVIHISNSNYVQIGDQASMSVQQAANGPQMEMAGEWDKENQS